MDTKGAIAIGVIGLLAGAAGGAMLFPVENTVVVKETVPVEVIKEVTKEVPVEKIVYQDVIKEVEVQVEDTEVRSMLCDRLLFEDVAECETEIKAENEALELAFKAIDSTDFFDFLQDEAIVEDEDDVKLKRIYKDFEDIEITASDFEDESYEFKITAKVYDDNDELNKKVLVTISVDEGEVDFEEVELIETD